MRGFDFLHTGSIKQDTNANWRVIRSYLPKTDWQILEVSGLRSAADEIVFIMYKDENGNFQQYNKLILIDAFKAIVDDLAVSEKQWAFLDELEHAFRPEGFKAKNARFLDTTLTFHREGRKVLNYLTINVIEEIAKDE